ncbi:MAG: Gfo/Idh/MocA family oxidoreductase [Rhodospirillaceae bacterium]|nr:Gfo/Idh/MocA family oxidoreductase [Rhodospirillaceae bacterium]MBT3887361.1 Gfo/Idh/MocA family oxidoreductase [Rhodospirillaceae bacterium]MBT4748599.1 Gfo/Idh/MocA family oxidoreductase [Rhodospirillaceae bacterium]MBT5177592.1 Gfo/Idh/MocA family oxidoreductase [Rhodospirillaceae bacterium]MBT6289154.1 Gfo/Idh/MocA family oxidoreductase [Rhodospirillaceae bacterium]
MINAAMVGLGWWGRYIVGRFSGENESQHLRFRRVVDIDAAAAQGFADDHGLELSADLDAALADDQIDAVIIATPNSLHGAQIAAAAAAHKHVFCEKPLDLTHAAAEASLAACKNAGIVLGIGHERRFEPAMVALKHMLEAGELGTVMHLEASFNHDKLVDLPADNWRASATEAPAASLTATGVHMTDAFLHFHGDIETVYALTGNWAANFQSGDLLSVQLRFKDGATGYINSILSSPLFSYFRVFGTKGWVQVSDSAHPSEAGVSTMTICRGEGDLETREFQSIDTVRANLEAFAMAAAGGAPYPFSGPELTGNIAVFEAICASVNSGAPEPVG